MSEILGKVATNELIELLEFYEQLIGDESRLILHPISFEYQEILLHDWIDAIRHELARRPLEEHDERSRLQKGNHP